MSTLRDRTGQRIGSWLVTGRRGTTKAGKVLWTLVNEGGRMIVLRTEQVIKLDREHGGGR